MRPWIAESRGSANTLERVMERVAEKEVERITAKCRRYQEQGKPIPAWVLARMDERFRQLEQVEHRMQILLGIFASHGALGRVRDAGLSVISVVCVDPGQADGQADVEADESDIL
jgi:hypothetical protein